MAKCPVCKDGKEDDGLSCTYCDGTGKVSREAHRQYLEFLLKEPLKKESIKKIFKPIRDEEE